MNTRNKSNSKLSPSIRTTSKSISKQEPLLKGKWDLNLSGTKSNKSSKSLKQLSHSNQQLTPQKTKQPNPTKTISRQYTKSTFQRYQQKLSINQKITELINEINERESRLKSYFEIYRLLESEMGQQRCLEHNNDLSLYCATQNKVLCVHCVYGESKHKTHKVLPLKDCIRDVGIDSLRLEETIKRDIDAIRLKIKTSQMNEKFIEKHHRQEIQQLQRIYVQKLKQIQVDFCQRKAYLSDYFDTLKQKNSELTHTLKEFQQNIGLKLNILGKDDHFHRHDSKLVSKQTILSKIAQLSDLKGMSLQNLDEKDIGQSCLRNRVTKAANKK